MLLCYKITEVHFHWDRPQGFDNSLELVFNRAQLKFKFHWSFLTCINFVCRTPYCHILFINPFIFYIFSFISSHFAVFSFYYNIAMIFFNLSDTIYVNELATYKYFNPKKINPNLFVYYFNLSVSPTVLLDCINFLDMLFLHWKSFYLIYISLSFLRFRLII